MKSKEKMAKLSKTAKVTFPFFALLAGQGFASSRNPLTLQSSKNGTGKSVIFINDIKIPSINAQITKNPSSPFAAFTNQSIKATQPAEKAVQSKVLKFLTSNDLLTFNQTSAATISGSLKSTNIKAFSHTFTFAGNNSNATEQCDSVTQYKSFKYSKSTYTFINAWCPNPAEAYPPCFISPTLTSIITFTNSTCTLFNNNTTNPTVSTVFNLAACQQQHKLCKGHSNLPVELQKFEIE